MCKPLTVPAPQAPEFTVSVPCGNLNRPRAYAIFDGFSGFCVAVIFDKRKPLRALGLSHFAALLMYGQADNIPCYRSLTACGVSAYSLPLDACASSPRLTLRALLHLFAVRYGGRSGLPRPSPAHCWTG